MMNVTSGSIHDNPWATVPREDEENGHRHNSTNHNNSASSSSRNNDDPRFANCTDWTLHQLVRVFLGVDVLCSSVLLIMGMAYLWQPHHAATVPAAILCGEVAICLGFRAMSVTASLYYSHLVDRSGFLLAAYVSLGLALQSILTTLLAVVFRAELRHRAWWAEHFSLTQFHSLLHNPSLEAWLLQKVEPWPIYTDHETQPKRTDQGNPGRGNHKNTQMFAFVGSKYDDIFLLQTAYRGEQAIASLRRDNYYTLAIFPIKEVCYE